ncbi:MAG: Mov34/MPN/PAD-1 family protein [Promethearchaeota archaeon]
MRLEKDIVFKVGRDITRKIDKCIEKAYPNEACGFLFGNIGEINNNGDFNYTYYSKIFQCIESSKLSSVAFLLDNDQKILELSNNITHDKKLQLLAIFHSHPTGANPSSIDKKCMKHYHNCGVKNFNHLVWIIVGSRNKDINGFIYLDNNLTQIKIEVSED